MVQDPVSGRRLRGGRGGGGGEGLPGAHYINQYMQHYITHL